LRQVVCAEAEELGYFGHLIGEQGRAGKFDHGADHVFKFYVSFGYDLLGGRGEWHRRVFGVPFGPS